MVKLAYEVLLLLLESRDPKLEFYVIGNGRVVILVQFADLSPMLNTV